MAKKNNSVMVGKYAFIIGILLAIIAGVIPSIAGYTYLPLILVVLGVIVGFLNIVEKNVTALLLGIVALIMVGGATVSVVPTINVYLQAILENFVAFVGAAGFIVAIKAILQTSKGK
jgi:hypothetical protein